VPTPRPPPLLVLIPSMLVRKIGVQYAQALGCNCIRVSLEVPLILKCPLMIVPQPLSERGLAPPKSASEVTLSNIDGLVVWQVQRQPYHGGYTTVHGEDKIPPSGLSGRQIPTLCKTPNFINDTGLGGCIITTHGNQVDLRTVPPLIHILLKVFHGGNGLHTSTLIWHAYFSLNHGLYGMTRVLSNSKPCLV
jgi:hypothetical protein